MNEKIQLQDIMPLEKIEVDYLDYGIYTALIVLISILVYILIKRYSKKVKTKLTKEQKSLKKLKELDLNSKDTKQLLYDFTILAKECVSQEGRANLEKILLKIEPLKYKKEDTNLDNELMKMLKGYIDEYIK